MSTPSEPPPSYDTAISATNTSQPKPNPSHLQVPQAHNGIPPASRRSMEDESRPLPTGWIRQFDGKEHHQFFVDTKADPPRSTWTHPYDDDEYLKTLSSEERERIQESERDRRGHDSDKMSAHSVEDEHPLPPRPGASSAATRDTEKKAGLSGFGRKMKDKVTGTTHEEREQARARREEEERKYYEAHLQFRQAMQRAQVTGQAQLMGKDKDGRDVYIEPPRAGYGGGGYGGYGQGGYGYNPYSSGPYANPNARFIRPQQPYGRPYGGGFGGGYGLPLAGGLLGGLLLGEMMF